MEQLVNQIVQELLQPVVTNQHHLSAQLANLAWMLLFSVISLSVQLWLVAWWVRDKIDSLTRHD